MEASEQRQTTKKIRLKERPPYLIVALVFLLMILLPHPIWSTIFLSMVGLYAISYLWVRLLENRIDAERASTRLWLSVGDTLQEEITIYNKSFLPGVWIELQDDSNIPGYQAGVAYALNGGESYRRRQSAICQQRGHFFIGPWRLRSGDPFGLFELTVDYGIEDDLLIYPPISTQIPFGIPAGRRHGLSAGREEIHQITQNPATVREYHLGDPMRWIHWPTSARRGELAVREFDIDAAGDIWILLDQQADAHINSGESSTEEEAILLASAIAAQALADQRAVGLASYEATPQLILPAKGVTQQWRLLYALAVSKANGELPLAEAAADLQTLIKRGSALIVITPRLTTALVTQYAQLATKEIRITTILFNRASYDQNRAEATSLSHLPLLPNHQQFDIYKGDIVSPFKSAESGSEFRVTPLGRVVRVEREEGKG